MAETQTSCSASKCDSLQTWAVMQVQQILMKHFRDMLLRNNTGTSHAHKYYSSFRKEETLHRMGVRQLMFPMLSPESTQMTGCNPQPGDALEACIRHSSLRNVYSKKQLMGSYILILKCLSTDRLNKWHHKNVIHLSGPLNISEFPLLPEVLN